MFKLTKLITVNPSAGDAGRVAITATLNAAAAPGGAAIRSMLKPTLAGVYNGGDYIWHVQFADEAGYAAWKADSERGKTVDGRLGDATLVSHVDSVAYEGGPAGEKPDAPAKGCYRVALFSVFKEVRPGAIAQYDAETYEMGNYIDSIKRWQVSRVTESSGARPWTHVWEQDYADVGGLHGAYMLHPHHWGHVDRWYDPECTDWMIDTHLCHTFCDFDESMIAPHSS
jgi:hypothetical protein